MKEQFTARMLRVHFGEDDRWQARITLAELTTPRVLIVGDAGPGIFGWMSARGIEGYGSASRIRHASHWPHGKDAPMQMSIIDSEEQIGKLIPFLDAMVEEGLVAASTVEAIRYSLPTSASANL